jgi:hypothetical protein
MEEKLIKSALEIALEKSKNIKISEKDIERENCIEAGKKIAGQYLTQKNYDLISALKSYKRESKKYVLESIESVFLSDIVLPRNKETKKDIRKVLEGIVAIKEDKQTVSYICGEIEQFLDSYIKTIEEYYRQLKKEFQRQFETARKEMESQLGMKVKIDVESNPEFQKQFREIVSQVDSQYRNLLDEYKQRLKSVPNLS